MFKNLRPLFPYLRKYRTTYWIGAVCVLCNNCVWILFPLVIRNAINDLNLGVTADRLKWYSFELLAVAGTKGDLPVSDPLDRDRRLARNRVRPAQ